jgi:gas vesicle protein
MGKFGSFLNGFLIGAVGAAAAVLLFTPKSGNQLRDDLKHEVDEILEEGRKASDIKRQEMENQLTQLRGQAPQ